MSAHHPSIQDGPILTYPSVEVAQPLEALPETQESTDMSSAHHSQPDLLFNSSPAFGLQLDQSHLSEFPFPKMPGSSFKNFSARPLMRIPPRLDLHSSTKREEHWSHLGTPPLCTSASSTPRSSGGLTPTDSLLSKSGSSWRFSLTSFRESSTSDPSSGDDCAYAQDSDLESDLDEDVPELGDFDPEVEGETFSSKFMRTYKTLPLALNDYTIDCELGTGGFGFVVKGTRRDNGQQVAIKCIFKNLMPGRGLVISSRWKNGSVEIPREADMLLRIDHPAVVKLIDLWEDEQLFYLVRQKSRSPTSRLHV